MTDFIYKAQFKIIAGFLNRPHFMRSVTILLTFALCISGLATVIILSEFSPLNSNLTSVIALLNLDLALAILLGLVFARKIISSWFKKKFRPAGSRLHIKMVF